MSAPMAGSCAFCESPLRQMSAGSTGLCLSRALRRNRKTILTSGIEPRLKISLSYSTPVRTCRIRHGVRIQHPLPAHALAGRTMLLLAPGGKPPRRLGKK